MAEEQARSRRWFERPLDTFRGILEPMCSQWSAMLCLVRRDDATHELRDALTQREMNRSLKLPELNIPESMVYRSKLYAVNKAQSKVETILITTGETVCVRSLENAIGVFMHGKNIHAWTDVALFDLNEVDDRVSFLELLPLPEKFRSLCILRRSSIGMSYAAETFDDYVKLNYHGFRGNETRTLRSVENCSLLGSYDERVYAIPTIGEARLIEFDVNRICQYGFIGDFRSKIVGDILYGINEDHVSPNENIINISTKSLVSLNMSRKQPMTHFERSVAFCAVHPGGVQLIPSYH